MKQKLLFIVCIVLGTANVFAQKNNLSYLKPEIGGVGHLLVPTRPTIQLPYQSIRMTPSRRDYLDDQISDFPLQVVSHRLGQVFSIMPSTDAVISPNSWNEKYAYDQDLEDRSPWHYQNFFTEKNISVDFVPGKKAAIFRFIFPKNVNKSLLLGAYNGSESYWKLTNNNTLEGMQYFEAEDNLKPVKVYVYGTFSSKTKLYSADNEQQDAVTGRGAKAYCNFVSGSDTVEFRYAISYISPQQAKQNFNDELKNISLNKLAAQGEEAWAKVMNQIQVEGGTVEQKESFYTALYRCYERMVNITEDGKYYSGYDNKIHEDKRPFYVDDWVWDTHHALHPLRMILQPTVEEDMLQSYVRMYEQSGWMPTFPVLYGDHACMNGFNSSIVFLDAYRKGLKNIDYKSAYEGMLKNSLSATKLPWKNGPATTLDSFYYTHGYFPALHPGEKEPYPFVQSFERRQAVAVTLGASYDDWATGQLAKEFGKTDDYKLLDARSNDYKNLWNTDKKFFLPKDSAGNWIMIDPKWDGGPGGRDYYDENNGWTYLWQVQENIPSLIDLMDGKQSFEQRLDQLFREDLGREKKLFWVKFTDATGLVGQFSMGNEPSFFIPYLYDYSNAPWKTQERIRILLNTWFHNDIFGIPGDEDGGGMSAFVVFSSLGFYPVTPGKPVYAIGSPLFTKASIRLQNGKTFTVIAHNSSKTNKYIQSAKLNGKPLNTPFFTHSDLINGGTLELEMGDRPNKSWGVVNK
ncbi:alpha-mannosidase [Arachidicoccus ginsenosidimutans]|uniref:GH92 family glycosyl hydrolase n=1 Tax=Arachidicoccus sp. BS20 TaxID=1850526 RepID=UPI0007F0D3D4|nr:GH92 family glycosyl hydrolase [Arachidicoccus sp. BS20]ANI90079.1 alpha-mannosidase [Arachidicoccus sp. BS20]